MAEVRPNMSPDLEAYIAERVARADVSIAVKSVNPSSPAARASRLLLKFGIATVKVPVTLIPGRCGRNAVWEGRFRAKGEVHRWMYDRVSLPHLMLESGFADAKVVSANESRDKLFVSSEVDYREGVATRPNLLYVEAVEPCALAENPRKITW